MGWGLVVCCNIVNICFKPGRRANGYHTSNVQTLPKSYAVNLLISVDSLKCENINWRRFWHLTLHYRRIKGLFEMSKTYAEPITVRCMPVRKVSELHLTSCWRVQKTSRDGEAAVTDWAVACRCSPSTALIKSMMGNDWLTHSLMLIGSDNRDAAFSSQMFYFVIWFHAIMHLNCAWIFPNTMSVRSLWEIFDCCHIFYYNLKNMN